MYLSLDGSLYLFLCYLKPSSFRLFSVLEKGGKDVCAFKQRYGLRERKIKIFIYVNNLKKEEREREAETS